MAVLLPNANLTVRRRADEPTRNEHGERVLDGWQQPEALLPGRTKENDNGRWDLAIDPSLWPVRTGDLVVDERGNAWSVQFVHLIENNYDDFVNYIKISAVRRVAQGTEPGGAWFVARYEEIPDDPVVDEQTLPTYADGLWRGHGPPWDYPNLIVNPGDQYLDLDTGALYEWGNP